jgi:general stress protein 26
MDTTDELETIRAIISSSKVAVLTTENQFGELHSRPLAVLDHEFDGSLWFFTRDPSSKVEEVAIDPRVNVSYSDGKGYLSISGIAAVEHNQTRIEQLWNPAVAAWFEHGRDDPAVALLRVDAGSAEYWASDKPAIARVFEFAKAAITDTTPDIGENRKVEL